MTPKREQKIKNVLNKRNANLTVVLENVHDPHNISAVLRTCDAVGIHEVYILDTVHPEPEQYGKKSSSSALKWINIHFYDDIEKCLEAVRKNYKKVYATYLSVEGKSLYDLKLDDSVALLFGNEKDGLSDTILKYADENFIIPQIGMLPSLNISVACAVTLYEVFRQQQAGNNFRPLAQDELNVTFDLWSRREMEKKRFY